MWIEHGRQSLLCLSLAPRGSPCSKLLTAPGHSNLRRTYLIFRGVDPTFHHKIFTVDHPLHQMAYFCVVWCCCNKQIWLQRKSSEKMKCVVMWLWVLTPILFSHWKAQIRVWAVKVSFDPRQFAHTVTYMDISTSSCSLQYQISFKAMMVSVGWVGSEWLNSECKKGTYLDISSVSPLWQN